MLAWTMLPGDSDNNLDGLSTDERLRRRIAQLRDTADFPGAAPRRRVLILSTPRCGSSMFCDALGKTGSFGEPLEWFNGRYIRAYAAVHGLQQVDVDSYLDWIQRKTTSANGVFSVNMHIEQVLELRHLNVNVFRLDFDHVYYLYRKDKLRQAISLAQALKSDQWAAGVRPKEGAGDVSHADITHALAQIVQGDDYCRRELWDRVDREFSYESFSDDGWEESLRTVLADLDLPIPESGFRTDYARQAGPQRDAVLEDFLRYLGQEPAS